MSVSFVGGVAVVWLRHEENGKRRATVQVLTLHLATPTDRPTNLSFAVVDVLYHPSFIPFHFPSIHKMVRRYRRCFAESPSQ